MTCETSHRPGEGRQAVSIDYEKYIGLLDEMNATDEQKQLYIETLAEILLRFVDLGFDVHPYSEDPRQSPQDSLDSSDRNGTAHMLEPM